MQKLSDSGARLVVKMVKIGHFSPDPSKGKHEPRAYLTRQKQRRPTGCPERAQKRSKAVQLELRRAIDGLIEDVSEKIQDGVDRGRQWTDTTTQGILGGPEFRKGLHSKRN